MDWFLYEIGLRRERVKENEETMKCLLQQRKSKKLNHLKYTPKPDSPSQTKEIKYWKENQKYDMPKNSWWIQYPYEKNNVVSIFNREPKH